VAVSREEVDVPVTDYDDFALAYARSNESSLFNAHYARPEVVRLLGDLTGRDVLDVGCGSGTLTESLLDGGAAVTASDRSAAMVELARERLGDRAELGVVDLAEPLPYADAAFDDAVACLVLHYLEDWSGPLAELRRVLRPGGRLVVVVNHPTAYPIVYPDADYFATTEYSEDYEFDGRTIWLTFWHRPLSAMADAFADAGFRIRTISEPAPAAGTPVDLLPPGLEPGQRFICFLFLVLEAV
jgi:SAM-dependent methyltransferase